MYEGRAWSGLHGGSGCTGGSCGLQLLLLVHGVGQQERLKALQQRQTGPHRYRLYMYICLGHCIATPQIRLLSLRRVCAQLCIALQCMYMADNTPFECKTT